MKAFERANKFFGRVKVKEVGNQVRITGIDGLILRQLFKQLFATDVVAKMMFSQITDTSMVIHRFFLPDFKYMLEKLVENDLCTWSGKRTVKKIIHGILTDTWLKSSVQPFTPMIDESRVKVLKWNPMEKQVEFLHLYGDRIPRYDLRGYIVSFAPGGGKAQPLDSLVRTDNGWITMGDITLNTRVVTPDGGTAAVTAIYPQGEKSIYRITFEDGRTAECCDEHLWKVRHKDWARSKDSDGWRVVTLRDIRHHFDLHPNENRLYIQLTEPEKLPDVNLPIDPYVLGILLGDGYTGTNSARISTADQFIVDEVSNLIPDNFELVHRTKFDYAIVRKSRRDESSSSEFLDNLRSLGVYDKRSYEKSIPNLYINSSPSQRLALLQGLMDSDGTVNEHGSPSFCTVSRELALQIQDIVRSLGGLVKIREKVSYYTHNGERKQGRLTYILNIRMKDPSSLFRLPRKKEATPENYQYADSLKLRIKYVEYVGKKEAQCISVDHPDHLYITNDYIVTHNTFAACVVASCVIPPSIAEVKIIISPKKALHLVWEKTLTGVFKKVPTYWCSDSNAKMPLDNTEYYIFNFEQLDQAIELGKALIAKGVRYFVIVDESHNFADYRSGRTQKLVKLQTLKDNIYFLWISGSPILKSGAELTSFLKCSDPRFDDDADRRFRKIYTSAPGRANEIFNHRLGNMMAFIVPKTAFSSTKPVVKELPVKLPPNIAKQFLMTTVREEMRAFIEDRLKFYGKNINEYKRIVNKWFDYHETKLNTKAERKAFKQYQTDLKIIMRAPDLMMTDLMASTRTYERARLIPSLPPTERKAFRNALSAVKNIKLKVRGEALGTVLAKRRSECATQLALYCKPDVIMKESLSKTLFFSSSLLPVATLARYLQEEGFEPILVSGATNSQLVSQIDRFTEDPHVNPICATMQSLSEAVPVTAASTVVLLNRPYRQATWDQIIARADRLGQKHPVSVIEVTLDTGGEPNVSSTADDILANVRELINEIVGEEFAGPDPDERVYLDTIDASKANPILVQEEEKLGL